MSALRQAVIYSFLSRYALRLIGLASTMVTARLLTPAELGTFAIASSIVMVISEFRLLGAGTYLIREQEIPEEKIRSALGLTVLISWGAGIMIIASSFWAAEFYGLPEVAHIFQLLAISFFVAPYISMPTALLQRDYKFKALFNISLACTLVGFVSTIGLILAGFSYYGLALGQIIRVAVELALIVFFWPKNMPWIPKFSGLREIASVGIFTSLVGLIRRMHVTVPDMVIGKLGTNAQVAMFSRGLGLVEFLSQTIMTGINPVALPYLSDVKRSGGDLVAAYTRAGILLGGVVCPVLAVAGLASLPTIRLFFGNQWDEAAPIAAWLALWGIVRCVHWLSMMVLIAQSCERILFFKELLILAILVAALIGLYPMGLEVIAIGFVAVALLDFLLSAIVLKAYIGLGHIYYLRAWISTIGVTAICALATLLVGEFVTFSTPKYWEPILIISLLLPLVWLGSLRLFGHPLYAELLKFLPAKLRRSR